MRNQTRLFFDLVQYVDFFNTHPLELDEAAIPSDQLGQTGQSVRGPEIIEAIRELDEYV
jgi:hypothetical protein